MNLRVVFLSVVGLVSIASIALFAKFIKIPNWSPIQRVSVWSIATCNVEKLESVTDCIPGLLPVLRAQDITDREVLFVADPFLIEHKQRIYMFFEMLDRKSFQGDIGVAVLSPRGKWEYLGVALDKDYHLSYPSVIELNGEIYLIPESFEAGKVNVYRPVDFPLHWELATSIIENNENVVDPTIFQCTLGWCMFTGRPYTHDQLSLFHSEEFFGPWRLHNRSPITDKNPGMGRPAGPIYTNTRGEIFRFTQSAIPRYGHHVSLSKIDLITEADYRETLLVDSIIGAQKSGWNKAGMHHISFVKVKDEYLVALDGHVKRFLWVGW